MPDKFRVKVASSFGGIPQNTWFANFYTHCLDVAEKNNWNVDTVSSYQLKPHGKLIKTKTQGWYIRWDDERYHNFFILKWS